MVEAKSNGRLPAPEKAGVAGVKLIQHRTAPVARNTRIANSVHGERHQDARLDDLCAYQPTPAECYGCVDWFQF